MEAVDFPKTGKPPKMLTGRWDEGGHDHEGNPNEVRRLSEDTPPERPERCPDFMEKMHEPMYIR
jgi:hypothetical protein